MKRALFSLGLLVALSGCEREAPAAAPEVEVAAPVPAVSGTYEFSTGSPADRDDRNGRWFYADLVAGASGLQVVAWRPDRQPIMITRSVWTGTELLLDIERTIVVEGEEQPERWTMRALYTDGDPTFRGPCVVTTPQRVLHESFIAQRIKISRASEEAAYDVREEEKALQPPVPEGQEVVTEDPYYANEHVGGRGGKGANGGNKQ
jgi:hypothetical protein